MNKREVIKAVLDGKKPPYTPWSFSFTQEPRQLLSEYYGTNDLESIMQNHIVGLGNAIGRFENIGDNKVKDVFGVIWDRSEDKDIGVVSSILLPEPKLSDYEFPNPLDEKNFSDINDTIKRFPDRFRVFCIGFSLYERAWTLRGMENLMMDFYDNPQFVHELLDKIADYNTEQVRKATNFDIDAVYFGDDWGQQHGLQMGYPLWKEFIYPRLRRMYGAVREAGKYVFIHSCGDVDELFDDLIAIGLNCFNPFQPEVMDTTAILQKYRGKLSFHGGLSTQRVLPYSSPDEVKKESRRLLSLGADGSYIFSPAHSVEGDVPLENIIAFIDEALEQPGFRKFCG